VRRFNGSTKHIFLKYRATWKLIPPIGNVRYKNEELIENEQIEEKKAMKNLLGKKK
jgi:hypothetical protein